MFNIFKRSEKTVLRNLICDSRRKALKINAKIPPRLPESESVNSIPAAKKSALVYSKEDYVWLSCFGCQVFGKIERAI